MRRTQRRGETEKDRGPCLDGKPGKVVLKWRPLVRILNKVREYIMRRAGQGIPEGRTRLKVGRWMSKKWQGPVWPKPVTSRVCMR